MKTREEGLAVARGLLLRSTAAQLAERHRDHFTEETIANFVEEVFEELEQRFTVKTHIPTFALRFSRDRLQALAKHEGKIVDHQPTVLFVCERNDAVSQMAAALFRMRVGDAARVHSAGTRPAPELLSTAVHALHEAGIEMLEEFPKPLTAEIERAADVIVTLDAHDTIELIENDSTQYFAWRVTADHRDDLESYRELRDELEPLVRTLGEEVIDSAAA